jgi:hypothetical protein
MPVIASVGTVGSSSLARESAIEAPEAFALATRLLCAKAAATLRCQTFSEPIRRKIGSLYTDVGSVKKHNDLREPRGGARAPRLAERSTETLDAATGTPSSMRGEA